MRKHSRAYILSLIVFTFIVVSFIGCASGLSNYESDFSLRYNRDEFDKYYIWHTEDLSNPADSIYFVVFSEKKEDLNIDTSKYEEIISNSVYKLNVFVVDSLLPTDANIKPQQGDFIILLGEGSNWYKGFIRGPIHFSKDIKGKYVLKGKRRK